MLRAFRFFCSGVSGRVLGIASLAVIFFVTGCTTSGNSEAQLAVATLSGGLPAGSVSVGGGAYPSTALNATGGTGPYTWAVTTGTLPTGLTLSGSGMVSGIPTTAGTFSFTVTVTDAATPTHHTAAASLSITVNPQLAITNPGQMTDGELGAVYPTKALLVTGGVGPFNWVINSGSLPGNLNLSSSGSVSGTISPAATLGNSNFTAKVTDSQGNVATSGTITLKVDPALMITPPTFPTGVVGVSYPAQTFTASGGSGAGYAFALASGSLPTPLILGANGMIASGMPTTAGTYTFTVKVTDSLNYTTTTSSLSITVNQAPAITTNPTNQSVTAGGNASFTAAASGIPAPTVQWLVSTDGGATYNNQSGANSTTLALPAVTAAMNGNRYRAVFTNAAGSATTTPAMLTVVPAPAITSFSPGAATITAGTSTTLTAVFTNGTGSVNNSVGALTSGTAVTVTPAATTTYTLTVTNAAGTSVTANATVTVAPAPVITSFTAGAATITAGTSTTLTAAFSNGTGSVNNGVGAVTSGAAVNVTPAATTTYTLTVTNPGGTSVTANVTVTVVPAPVITSFTAGAARIAVGNSTTLTAVFSNGTGSVDHGVGAVTSGTPVAISPSVTTTYNLTVTNAATTPATTTATTTVTVDTPPQSRVAPARRLPWVRMALSPSPRLEIQRQR
jgi:hypothetical protein